MSGGGEDAGSHDLHAAAVVFDLDGTLVDSRLDFAAMRSDVLDLLAAAGIPWTGARREVALAELLSWARQAGGDGPQSAYAEAMRRVGEAERIGDTAPAMDGASAVLAALRREGAAIAVLTNNAREGSWRQLDRLGLRQAVDFVLTRDDVPALKPDPRGLRMAFERLGDRPQRWFVGDSWIDAAAAHALGVPFLAMHMAPEVLERHGLPAPAAHIRHLSQVLEAVRRVAHGTGG